MASEDPTATMAPTLKTGDLVGAVDCGTTSARFIVFDETAAIVAQHQLEFPQYYPHSGWHEHDAEEMQRCVEACIDQGMANLEAEGWSRESVRVVGITNQRETTVAWDRSSGKPLCKAIVWDDGRTRDVVDEFTKKLDEEGFEVRPGEWKKGNEAKEALFELTGLRLSTYFSAIKLAWMVQQHPEVKAAMEEDRLMFGTVDSWLIYNLTGGTSSGLHVTDPTNASRTLLLDLHTLTFHDGLCAFFGVKNSALPKLASSSNENDFGVISTGALNGVKIGGVVGDQQGALVGNKCLQKGEAKCTYGTGAFLLFCTGEDVVRSHNGLVGTVAYQAHPNSKPVYALEGSIAVAGSAIQWLRDSLMIINNAPEINTLAAEAEDSGELYFVPAFGGLLAPYWDPTAAGILIGVSSYTNRAHIARATLEACAFQTHAIVDAMRRDSGVPLSELRVDGGMTNGEVAMQIVADLGGFDVVRPEMRESTALGAALLAGNAVGLFGWDLSRPETLKRVNERGVKKFSGTLEESERQRRWQAWKEAVRRSSGWDEGRGHGSKV
ncbi:glycerol kinase [Auricularia subglabra TFB-10046 SS5]|nr:glycerol kinase [Auricularia subglabra TFB-10046 SS5]